MVNKLKDPLGRLARWHLYLLPYQITFVHRKGNKHTNVDALTRIISEEQLEINSIETSIQDEPNSSKLLDVWEDANLLEYLKTGIHLPGLSQRQAKRIHRIASHYKFYNNKLYFTLNQN